MDGRVLLAGEKRVRLAPLQGALQHTMDLARPLAEHGRDRIYLRIALDIRGRTVSEDSVLFTLPRFIELPRSRTKAAIRMRSARSAVVTFSSPVFQHRFAFDFTGHDFACSDNFFELFPGERKAVTVDFGGDVGLGALRRALAHMSLADSY
jgi:beta-mannosidase